MPLRALPVRRLTVNRLVAYNMAAFRKAAGLTQEEVGERLGGWSGASVSAAERSWDGKRVKKFDADEIVAIAFALGVPISALFLPPEDDGTAVRYMFDTPGSRDGDLGGILLTYAYPAHGGDSPAMDAYRKRIIAAGASGRLEDPVGKAGEMPAVVQRAGDEAIEMAHGLADRAPEIVRGETNEALGRALREADEVLIRARRQAEQITGDAQARAENLDRDAQERYRQATAPLVQTREELERRVDDLRAFEREYRTKLQAFMESQFLELWTPQLRPEMERALDELRKRAASGEGGRVSAVLLREDGSYDVVQLGREGQGDAGPQEEQEEPGGYEAPLAAEGGSAR
jgi:transcriptional regulator with XRE-family HTH domain/cell division septum initiation protein DivIVA